MASPCARAIAAVTKNSAKTLKTRAPILPLRFPSRIRSLIPLYLRCTLADQGYPLILLSSDLCGKAFIRSSAGEAPRKAQFPPLQIHSEIPRGRAGEFRQDGRRLRGPVGASRGPQIGSAHV